MFRYSIIYSFVFLISACSSLPDAETPPEFKTQVRWTSYGIPHVKADDWASLGYGFAYATAVDGFCVIADSVMLSNGDRSRYNGPGNGNIQVDTFHRAMLSDVRVSAYFASQSANDQAFSRGYAAGYNRYLRDHVDDLPEACVGKPWVRPISINDLIRMNMRLGIAFGMGRFDKDIFSATPPNEQISGLPLPLNTMTDDRYEFVAGIGSNAIALGSEVSESGRGVLFGNPHYPWKGPLRFHMIHTTIPGELDVMGSSLLTTNRVVIGFNKDVAWSHTVSTATRFTLYRLELNPANPLEYRFGDDYREIVKTSVEVDVLDADGNVVKQQESVYQSHYGPIVMSKVLPWDTSVAFAIRDVNYENTRANATWDAVGIAETIDDIETGISLQGMPFVNTIAADRHGTAFYADISATPNLDAEMLSQCRESVEHLPAQIVVLDGSDPACEWKEDSRSAVPGAMPAEDMPRIRRKDYVTNSNDSYWLSNPNQPLEGYSPIIGDEQTERSLRTRAGLNFIEQELTNKNTLGPQDLQSMIYSQRNFAAEILLDDVLVLCEQTATPVDVKGTPVDINAACAALLAWDRHQANDSRGAQVWTEFWRVARKIPDVYAVPFDVNDPVHTPDGIAIDNESVAEAIRQALANTQLTLETAGIALDARWGDVQYAERNGEKIGIPGGQGWAGMFSMIVAGLQEEKGYTPIVHGNSYMQVISWDQQGRLDARGMLTYSQSQDPDSAHYDDLTRLYSDRQWIHFPFSDEEIQADPELFVLDLLE
ncbi:MAG: penicillin acylase family protein [Xanthomonadales bacterium]|nr:penicillin acylase family protein [Xanthomonadales bacterium]